MGTLYVVRHGQAAFGTDDYDRLTPLGLLQSRRLGVWFAERGVRFDHVLRGTMRRHAETAAGILDGMGLSGADIERNIESVAHLNEYDPEAILLAHTGALPDRHEGAERRDPAIMRAHFRLLREALYAWADGQIEPPQGPSFSDFQSNAVAALAAVRARHPDGNVLVVSSGGPISATVGHAMQTPTRVAIDLNLQLRNTGVTEYSTNPKRHQLLSFNGVAHLESLNDPALVTWA